MTFDVLGNVICTYCDTQHSDEGFCSNTECPVHLLQKALLLVQTDISLRKSLNKQRVREAIALVKQWEHHNSSEDWEVELYEELNL